VRVDTAARRSWASAAADAVWKVSSDCTRTYTPLHAQVHSLCCISRTGYHASVPLPTCAAASAPRNAARSPSAAASCAARASARSPAAAAAASATRASFAPQKPAIVTPETRKGSRTAHTHTAHTQKCQPHPRARLFPPHLLRRSGLVVSQARVPPRRVHRVRPRRRLGRRRRHRAAASLASLLQLPQLAGQTAHRRLCRGVQSLNRKD
jgi:hypothetical protein